MNLDPSQSLHRLGIDGYQRPKKTYTDTLQTDDAIQQKLNGFIEVDENDIDNLSPGSYLRYIKWDLGTGKERFVMGGVLLRVNPEYLLIKGKDNGSFSAQRYTYNKKGDKIHTTRFFKQLNNEEKLKIKLLEMQKKANEIIMELEETIDKQAEEITELKDIIKKLKNKK
jgi:hypothetical protein